VYERQNEGERKKSVVHRVYERQNEGEKEEECRSSGV